MSLDKAIEHGRKSASRIAVVKPSMELAETTDHVSGAGIIENINFGTSTQQRRASE